MPASQTREKDRIVTSVIRSPEVAPHHPGHDSPPKRIRRVKRIRHLFMACLILHCSCFDLTSTRHFRNLVFRFLYCVVSPMLLHPFPYFCLLYSSLIILPTFHHSMAAAMKHPPPPPPPPLSTFAVVPDADPEPAKLTARLNCCIPPLS